MDRRKKRHVGWTIGLFLAFLLLAAVLMSGLFADYRARVQKLFVDMAVQDMRGSAMARRQVVQADIDDATDTLQSMAAAIQTADSADRAWIDRYISAVCGEQGSGAVTYLTAEELAAGAADYTPQEQEGLEELRRGQTVVTPLYAGRGEAGGYTFYVAAPVLRQGQLTGVLYCSICGEMLTGPTGEKTIYGAGESYLVYGSGTLVVLAGDGAPRELDLIDELRRQQVPDEQVAQLQAALESGESTVVRIAQPGGQGSYVAVEDLGYNGWRLFCCMRTTRMTGHPTAILRYTVILAVALIALLALLGGVGVWLFWGQRRRLRMEEERYALLARFSDTVLLEYDHRDKTLQFTPNIQNQFAVAQLNMRYTGRGQGGLSVLHPQDAVLLDSLLKKAASLAPGQNDSCQLRMWGRDGRYHWMRCQYQTLYDARTGRPERSIGKLMDISEQKRKEEALRRRSALDRATSTFNKAALEEQVGELLQGGTKGFLFMIDLDDFKRVNDCCGHAAGDALLRAVGTGLRHCFRQEDMVGRVGGDEFAVFMVGAHSDEIVQRRAARIISSISTIHLPDLPGHAVTASVGVARTADRDDYQALYGRADQAMYRAKRGGKNRFCLYRDTGETE